MTWLVNNLGSVVTVGAVVCGVIATWVLYGADIKQLKKDNGQLDNDLREMIKAIHEHMSDTTVHIDPHRDEKRWDDLKSEIFRRFDSMEGKMDKLMIIHKPQGPLI